MQKEAELMVMLHWTTGQGLVPASGIRLGGMRDCSAPWFLVRPTYRQYLTLPLFMRWFGVLCRAK